MLVKRPGETEHSIPARLVIDIRISTAQARTTVGFFVVLNLIILTGMWRFLRYFQNNTISYDESPDWIRFGLVQFNLATENVFASWYSSVLLLMVSFACLLNFIADLQRFPGGRDRILSYGWLFIGLVFMALSADEMGSWHEAIGMLPFNGGDSLGWVRVLAVPMAIVALLIAAFMWLHLRRQRLSFWLMAIGLGLFIINPFLELAEMALLDSRDSPSALRQHDLLIWIEEGAELFGSLGFLAGAAFYARQLKRIQLEMRFKTVVMLTALLGTLFTLALLATDSVLGFIQRGDSGIAQNWFPSALAMMVCLVSFHLATTRYRNRHSYYGMATFALILSAYYGINTRGWLYDLDYARQLVDGGLVLMVFLISISFSRQIDLWWYRVASAFWLILFAITLYTSAHYTQWPDVAVAIVPLLLLLPHFNRQSILLDCGNNQKVEGETIDN